MLCWLDIWLGWISDLMEEHNRIIERNLLAEVESSLSSDQTRSYDSYWLITIYIDVSTVFAPYKKDSSSKTVLLQNIL